MITIISQNNKIVRQSDNLLGIWERTRRLRAKPEATITEQRDGSAQVYLCWPNADTCHHTWASALLAQERFAKAASRVTFHSYQERTCHPVATMPATTSQAGSRLLHLTCGTA